MESLDCDLIQNQKQKSSKPINKEKMITSVIIAGVFISIVFVCSFLANNYLMRWPIEGASMEPTFHDGDKVLLHITKNVDYGDVIIFYHELMDKHLIKRVIGKEGDEIKTVYNSEEKKYDIYRNGVKLSDSYISEPINSSSYSEKTVIVPKDSYYVLGDNRNASYDSHYGFFCSEKNIKGVVFLLIETDGHSYFEKIQKYEN